MVADISEVPRLAVESSAIEILSHAFAWGNERLGLLIDAATEVAIAIESTKSTIGATTTKDVISIVRVSRALVQVAAAEAASGPVGGRSLLVGSTIRTMAEACFAGHLWGKMISSNSMNGSVWNANSTLSVRSIWDQSVRWVVL
jgi:hypothetical protein